MQAHIFFAMPPSVGVFQYIRSVSTLHRSHMSARSGTKRHIVLAWHRFRKKASQHGLVPGTCFQVEIGAPVGPAYSLS